MKRFVRQTWHAITGAPLAFRPGHYYSAICDPQEAANRLPKELLYEIDLRRDIQLTRWEAWQPFLPAAHWKRYPAGSHTLEYPIGDALSFSCFLRELKPRRLIEVGCGYSTACMLDTIEAFNLNTRCTFIDPFPERLSALLKAHSIITAPVQRIPLETFDELAAGDVLFINSTHVLKTGSDVHHELFVILPRLRPGVFVHFHDIFYPFEYPDDWIRRNFSWNEAYGLHALLADSARYKIEFWNNYLTVTGTVDFGSAPVCG